MELTAGIVEAGCQLLRSNPLIAQGSSLSKDWPGDRSARLTKVNRVLLALQALTVYPEGVLACRYYSKKGQYLQKKDAKATVPPSAKARGFPLLKRFIMNKSKYTSKGPSRQEAVSSANQIKSSTVPGFATREDGYFKCEILGYEVRLRFDCAWTAYCPGFNIEVQFTNRTDEAMITFLSDWLQARIERPQAPAAQHRQATPAVLYLAEYHDIATLLADEIMRGR